MKKNILYIIDIVLLILLVFIDHITKNYAVLYLKDKPAYKLIDGVLELNYLENRGAAFGMFENQKYFFILVAVVFLAVIVFVLIKAPNDKKYIKLHLLLILISSGAIGNMIDRIKLEYVVDFIYFSLINFPIFNFADICVTIGTFLLMVQVLFIYKEQDFYFLSFNPKKFKEFK